MTKHEEEEREAEFTDLPEAPEYPLPPFMEDDETPVEPTNPLKIRIVMTNGMPALECVFHDSTESQYPEWIAARMKELNHGGFFIDKVFVQDSKVHYFEQI